jgi:hypothetical protein
MKELPAGWLASQYCLSLRCLSFFALWVEGAGVEGVGVEPGVGWSVGAVWHAVGP